MKFAITNQHLANMKGCIFANNSQVCRGGLGYYVRARLRLQGEAKGKGLSQQAEMA